MHYLGIDYGERRIGLSYADELGIAFPLPSANQNTLELRLDHIRKQIKERRTNTIVVGYPYNMDGSVSQKALEVDKFIANLEIEFGLPAVRYDERLTSHQAAIDMDSMTKKKKKSVQQIQKERASGVLDSRAAAIILQDYLDQHSLPPTL